MRRLLRRRSVARNDSEQKLFRACEATFVGMVCEVDGADRAFDPQPRAERVTLIRIHGENTEAEFLRRNLGLLTTHRPIVLCRVGPDADVRLLDALRRRTNYVDVQQFATHCVLGATIGFDAAGPLHALVPFEKLGRVAGLLHDSGVELRDPDGAVASLSTEAESST